MLEDHYYCGERSIFVQHYNFLGISGIQKLISIYTRHNTLLLST